MSASRKTICRTFVCVPYGTSKQNITARRGALRDTRKSAHCLRCAGHAPVGLSKRGRDTESDANIQPEEMLTFFSNEFPPAFPHEIPKYVSKPYYLSTQSTICFVRQFLFLPYLYCIISWFVISFHSSFVMPSFSSVSTICTQSDPNVRYRLPPTVISCPSTAFPSSFSKLL